VQAEGKGEGSCRKIRMCDVDVGKKPFDHCTNFVNFVVVFSPFSLLDSTYYTLQYAVSLTHLAVLLLLPPPPLMIQS
jgi:hypothetical protein